MNFNFYVRGVLPVEWRPGLSPDESLRAGALAIRSYSWYQVTHYRNGTDTNPSSPTYGQCYDVNDNPYLVPGEITYQAYDPSVANDRTDRNVSWVWNDIIRQPTGSVYEAHYVMGTYTCGTTDGATMEQLGADACADQGHDYRSIVNIYYTGPDTKTLGNGPGVSASSNQYLDVVIRGSDGNVYQIYCRVDPNTGQYVWGQFGLGQPPNGVRDDPTAAWSNFGNRLDVFVRDNNNDVYVRTWTPSSGWQQWAPLPNSAKVSEGLGAASQRAGSAIDLFGRNTALSPDPRLTRFDGANWSGWADVATPTGIHENSIPWNANAVWWSPSGPRLDMYVIANDIYNSPQQLISSDGINWGPSYNHVGPANQNGQASSAAAVGAPYDSGARTDIFLRGLDNALYQMCWDSTNGVWAQWVDHGVPIGSSIQSGPGVTYADDETTLYVFVRGEDDGLYMRSLSNARNLTCPTGDWGPWILVTTYP